MTHIFIMFGFNLWLNQVGRITKYRRTIYNYGFGQPCDAPRLFLPSASSSVMAIQKRFVCFSQPGNHRVESSSLSVWVEWNESKTYHPKRFHWNWKQTTHTNLTLAAQPYRAKCIMINMTSIEYAIHTTKNGLIFGCL